MKRVAVVPVDDPDLDWGTGQGSVGAFARRLSALPPGEVLANGRVEFSALQLRDRAFVLATPTGAQACWLTSLQVTYGPAARDEIHRALTGLESWVLQSVSLALEGFLRLTRSDRIVYVNHLLFSTSLYGTWSGQDLAPAMKVLRAAFPGHAVVWRSLNAPEHEPLLEQMSQLGARRIVSRIVWRLADPPAQWSPRTDVRSDLKLFVAQALSVHHVRTPTAAEIRRCLALYEDVYRAKYSRTNPAYRPSWFVAAIETDVLTLDLIRGPAGDILAFAADHVHETALTSPMLGHDRTRPREMGLYRAAMTLSVSRALRQGLSVNCSGGAGEFKRNRGACAAVEFIAVFDDHLPWWRRLGYAALSSVTKRATHRLEQVAGS